MTRTTKLLTALAAAAATAALGAGGAVAAPSPIADPSGCALPKGAPVPGSGKVRRVPSRDHPTITDAVAAAAAGDTVLISPGVYREAVVVTKPSLRIRGTDRARVVLDGEVKKPKPPEAANLGVGIKVEADDVVVENLTIRHFLDAPVWASGVRGFWLRYVTTYRNRLHNLVIGSHCVQIDHLYAHWHGAAALAVNWCGKTLGGACNTTITESTFSRSAYGVVAEDSDKGLRFVGNVVENNHFGVGILPTGPMIDPVPHGRFRIVVADNRVLNNDEIDSSPALVLPNDEYRGIGIGIGSMETLVRDNVVDGHGERPGIAVLSLFGGPTAGAFNEVRDNVVGCGDRTCFPDQGTSPQKRLTYGADLAHDISGPGTCWRNNKTRGGGEPTSLPPQAQTEWACRDDPEVPDDSAPGDSTGPGTQLTFFAAAVREPCTARCTSPAWNAPESERPDSIPSDPAAYVPAPDDNGNGDYQDDRGVDTWLPAVVPWKG